MACDSPYYVLPKAGIEKVPVPCGKCPPCKMRRVNQWVFRLMQEEKISSNAHFVTLTYDTSTVPISENGFMTLDKSDLQKFFKRLRKLCPDENIKYYAVGEYGTNNKRPHYHAIVYNVPDSNLYAKAWSIHNVQIGSIHVGRVTSDSVAYTMKYIDKANFRKKHGRDDRVPEFPVMSKRLGDNYITDATVKYHKEHLDVNCIIKRGGERIAMPRYYREKILSSDEKKQQRQIIKNAVHVIEIEQFQEFERGPYGNHPTYDYVSYLDNKRVGRYKSFYANQKERDV